MAFVFGLQTLQQKDFSKIYQLKGLKLKNKGHINFYECCDLAKKVYLMYIQELTDTKDFEDKMTYKFKKRWYKHKMYYYMIKNLRLMQKWPGGYICKKIEFRIAENILKFPRIKLLLFSNFSPHQCKYRLKSRKNCDSLRLADICRKI